MAFFRLSPNLVQKRYGNGLSSDSVVPSLILSLIVSYKLKFKGYPTNYPPLCVLHLIVRS